jgi:hypothetical protein
MPSAAHRSPTLPSLLALALLGVGCATPTQRLTITDEQYRQGTAAAVGCPPEEIVLSGQKHDFVAGEAMPPFRATCRGHVFICGSTGREAKCTEELPPSPRPATP